MSTSSYSTGEFDEDAVHAEKDGTKQEKIKINAAEPDERDEYLSEKKRHYHWRNLLSDHDAKVQVYTSGEDSIHAIWFLRGPCKADHKPIPFDSRTSRYLRSTPGSAEHNRLKEAEQFLAEAFYDARKYIEPKATLRNGFIIEGSDDFGMEAGNVFGTRISYRRIDVLLEHLENENHSEASIKDLIEFFKGEFVHERTHNIRDEAILFSPHPKYEVASHAVQFISLEGKNLIFNRMMKMGMRGGSHSNNIYDVAQTAALKVLYLKLSALAQASHCKEPRSYDPEDLAQSIETIAAEKKPAILRQIVDEIIATSGIDLLALAESVESIEDTQAATKISLNAVLHIDGEVTTAGKEIEKGDYTVIDLGGRLGLHKEGIENEESPFLEGATVRLTQKGMSARGSVIPPGTYVSGYITDVFLGEKIPILYPDDGSEPYTIDFERTHIEVIAAEDEHSS